MKKCGGCSSIGQPYEDTLSQKAAAVQKLLKPYCHLEGIVGMKEPLHYRNKVHRVCTYETHGKREYHISGIYKEGSHEVVAVRDCLIEDARADRIIEDILELAQSFRIRYYNEDTGRGLLRHILIRTAHATGQIMVVLVSAQREFPGKNHFVKELLKRHPEITTVVFNINDRRTNMILGTRGKAAYGTGYIEDELCGMKFRISPESFYQVNPGQTERLYRQAIRYADLSGKEEVLDAYCGIGTIGMAASSYAGRVIGVESNRGAVRDATANAKRNNVANISFVCMDAGEYMMKRAATGGHGPDVLFMDPPRAGASEEFLAAAAVLSPEKIVYISCSPETLARDLEFLTRNGYRAEHARAFDMFPFTPHCEVAVSLSRR